MRTLQNILFPLILKSSNPHILKSSNPHTIEYYSISIILILFFLITFSLRFCKSYLFLSLLIKFFHFSPRFFNFFRDLLEIFHIFVKNWPFFIVAFYLSEFINRYQNIYRCILIMNMQILGEN